MLTLIKKQSISILFILLLTFVGSLVIPNTAYAAKAQDEAKAHCKDSKQKASCIRGYVAGYTEPTVASPCRSLSGPKKSACSSGFNAGKIAGGGGSTAAGSLAKCTRDSCDLVSKYINPAVNALSVLVGLLAVASLIFAGIQYSAASSDPQKIAQAKDRIYKTILGIILYTFLFSFLQFLVPGGIF